MPTQIDALSRRGPFANVRFAKEVFIRRDDGHRIDLIRGNDPRHWYASVGKATMSAAVVSERSRAGGKIPLPT